MEESPASPTEYTAGYGPWLTALVGEIAGTHGTSRWTIQTCRASVLHIPVSLGAIQQMIARVTQAIVLIMGRLPSRPGRPQSTTLMKRPGFSPMRSIGCG